MSDTPSPALSGDQLLRTALWRERKLLCAAYAAALIAVACVVVAPWPLKIIIDGVLGTAPLPGWLTRTGLSSTLTIAVLGGAGALAGIIAAIAGAQEKNLNALVRERATLEVRDTLLAHLQTLSLNSDPAARNGELAMRIMDDVQQVVRLWTKTAPMVARHAGVTLSLLCVMWSLDPRLGLTGIATIGILLAITRLHARSLQRAAHDKRTQEGEVAGLTQELIRGLANVQTPQAAAAMRADFRQRNVASLEAGVRENQTAVAMERTMQIANALAMAAVTGFGAWLVLQRLVSLGELTVFLTYMTQLLKPVEKVNELASNTSRALVRAARVHELLQRAPAVLETTTPLALAAPVGVIEARGVTFSYPASAAQPAVRLLDNINVRFAPGALHVIGGASGSGKTTFFRLLTRTFDPVAGELYFDDIAYRALGLRDLRRQVLFIAQVTHVFAGTLRQAVTPPGQTLADADLLDALDQVALAGFVGGLAQGLDTVLGEDAANLSGGQRTRLAIARAILSECRVLLFDEPLANIDALSQRVIVQALETLARERTCLVVSHQVSAFSRNVRWYQLTQHSLHELDAPPPRDVGRLS